MSETKKLLESIQGNFNESYYDDEEELNINVADENYNLPDMNYELENGEGYIHIHPNEEGYYFDIYKDGILDDGGLLEYSEIDAKPQSIDDIKKRVAEFMDIKISDKEVSEEFIEELQDQDYDAMKKKTDGLKESDEVPYADDVNAEELNEDGEEEEVAEEETTSELSPEVQAVVDEVSGTNDMYKWVIDDVFDSGIDGYNGDTMDEKLKAKLEDIGEHGCVSGMVSSMIYYTDTVKFFDDFNDEIYDLIDDNFGGDEMLEIMKSRVDATDIIMGADTSKNYLAWMAYEYVCSTLLDAISEIG